MLYRLTAIVMCLFLLPFSVLAEETVFVPFTRSESVQTQSGVTTTGTKAFVDFDYLRSINPDTVGWLYQESTGFSLPVMQGADNEYYRNHTFDNTRLNGKGSIYLDA